MARPPLTLAALATAAVAGLEVNAARPHTRRGAGAFDSVELHSVDGRHLLIRAPRSQTAETEQSADLVALRALTPGIRSRLPFAVPSFIGQAPLGGTRAIVTEFIPGAPRTADELTEYESLAVAVGLAIAAIHALPPGFIGEAGLPKQSAVESREAVVQVIDRASDTGRLPAALLRRWEEATDDDALWRFQPTVVNGQLGAESILVEEDRVTGILGWSGLAQGDPAVDLLWLLTSRGAAAEQALDAYVSARAGGADAHLTQRALLYGELELARWLLHGIDTHDDAIVEDAVGLLDGLVASVHDRSTEPLAPETGPILAVGDVERMLDATPRGVGDDRDPGTTLLTDSFDRSELRRALGVDGSPDGMDLTAPIPLDLSDWGDAAPPSRGEAGASGQASSATGSADAEAADARTSSGTDATATSPERRS